MKKSILMGLGVCALALGGVAALVGQKGAVETKAALDPEYIYFKTPWNNATSDLHVWNTNDDATDVALTKAANYVWKISRSSISGYANFIVRGEAGTWGSGKTGDLKYSVFAKADYVRVFENTTGTDRWSLFCTGSDWKEDANYAFTFNNTDEVKLTGVNITKNDTLKVVKIYNDGSKDADTTYYGYDVPLNKSIDSDAGKFNSDGSDNIVAKEDGTYSFFFNMSGGTNSIWITDTEKAAIDGWAEHFIGVSDFCDAEDTDWADYASSFAGLSAKAQQYFNDATANPAGNNIQKAAARYDNAVTNHGKAPFAGGTRASANNSVFSLIKEENNAIGFIALASVSVSVLAAGGLVLLSKKIKAE